jgi:hypothetical protein
MGISSLKRKVYKEQAERDLTLMERFELHSEKAN